MSNDSAAIDVVVLAAGKGTRMRSGIPKVLHPIAHQSMLGHVLDVVDSLRSTPAPVNLHVVYGHGGDQVRETFSERDCNWVLQKQQLGTGHAVNQAMPSIEDDSLVLVLCGDVPLIMGSTLRELISVSSANSVGLLTVEVDNPTGYGRILRDDSGSVLGIVEEKDASDTEKLVTETNTGILVAPSKQLRKWLSSLKNDNAQGELYLTDVIGMAVREGVLVNTVHPQSSAEVMGINNKIQLAAAEREYQNRQAVDLMVSGATLRDPARVDVRGTVELGQDVCIDVNVVFSGAVTLGSNVSIGQNCVISDASIGDNVVIKANSVVENAIVGAGSVVGPFARLRPQTVLGEDVSIGNFVEVKKSTFGDRSKAGHLSYVGDATIGAEVNIGAGVITCNYDGLSKHKTIIGDGAFVGSNCELIAPVSVGENATVGAGTTLVDDAPGGQLSLSRPEQVTLSEWIRPKDRKNV